MVQELVLHHSVKGLNGKIENLHGMNYVRRHQSSVIPLGVLWQGERITHHGVYAILDMLLYMTVGISLPSSVFAVAFSLPHSR